MSQLDLVFLEIDTNLAMVDVPIYDEDTIETAGKGSAGTQSHLCHKLALVLFSNIFVMNLVDTKGLIRQKFCIKTNLVIVTK